MKTRLHTPSHQPHQLGYTLVEILVALLIGVFLLAGLFTILQNTRRTSSNQTGLSQLQDEERMAMSLLTDVIQNAGYFDPGTTTAANAMPAASYATGALTSGQGVSGVLDASGNDIIIAQYKSNGTTDGIVNCNGTPATSSTAPITTVSTFYINSTSSGGVTTYALYCAVDGTVTTGIPLVTGITSMQIFYGVSTVTGSNNVDTYMTAAQVAGSTGGWPSVSSVRVTLKFQNPLYNAGNAASTGSQYVYLTRVIRYKDAPV